MGINPTSKVLYCSQNKDKLIYHQIMKFSRRKVYSTTKLSKARIASPSNQQTNSSSSRNKFILFIFSSILLTQLLINLVNCQQTRTTPSTPPPPPQNSMFPGVSRDLASFCAARPSLQIDLASMVVHVKKNISFNYKLYLFSTDYVFQTGQVIPRDDFRIHSFPVKLKRLNEFWPENVPTYQYKQATVDSLTLVSSNQFNMKQFFSLVSLNPQQLQTKTRTANNKVNKPKHKLNKLAANASTQTQRRALRAPEDAHGDLLPGDPVSDSEHTDSVEVFTSVGHHNAATNSQASFIRAKTSAIDDDHDHEDLSRSEHDESLNKNIHFDRDDQLSTISRRRAAFASDDYLVLKSERDHNYNSSPSVGSSDSKVTTTTTAATKKANSGGKFSRDSMLPVGSFSSFKVNLTYLVRKDFDQKEPQLIRLSIDSSQFVVQQLDIINNGSQHISSLPQNEDYDFLSHKILRDLNTRITAINQIYEDWITRNFYTIVYIQRRLEETNNEEQTIVNDRLVFRGTSIALLGADQLDYSVKAAAFITEKNGLHYYLEFLNTGKFYLCAVDWTKRPFKIIDSKKFPIKATRTQLDNEELLLCPPSVCYSTQPVDEVISYGRINLPDKVQREASILSMSLSSDSVEQLHQHHQQQQQQQPIVQHLNPLLMNETNLIYSKHTNSSNNNKEFLTAAEKIRLKGRETTTLMSNESSSSDEMTIISLDNVIDSVKAGSIHLQTRLHLRDWIWILSRNSNNKVNGKQQHHIGGITNRHNRHQDNDKETTSNEKITSMIENGGDGESNSVNSQVATKFELRYEMARRNDVKVKPDTYGYVLTGHEIDASYRVYNELYLISANHLITINYTLANETVIHTHPIGDEFFGLSSTLLDPITGAFYDRYANQIFFFKADRYVGYDYATKKPLEDFLLQTPPDVAINSGDASILISSLPVVGILGYQSQVDGVYHDFASDFVYIFSGMKYYTFLASEFKNGSFKRENKNLPQMHCINERFLDGCNFDEAYQNPCHSSEPENEDDEHDDNGEHNNSDTHINNTNNKSGSRDKSAKLEFDQNEDKSAMTAPGSSMDNSGGSGGFNEEQQMKLRKIASTRAGLLNLIGAARAIEPLINNQDSSSGASQTQEKIFVYLLIAMVVLTILVSIVMIVLIVNWTKLKLFNCQNQELNGQNTSALVQQQLQQQQQTQLGNNYMSNQRQHHSNHRHPYRHSRSGTVASSNDRSSKPLGSVSVVVAKSSRRHAHGFDNSAL